MQTSQFVLFSYGIAATDIERGSATLEVWPVETLSTYDGDVLPDSVGITTKGVDADGNPYENKVNKTATIEAEWLGSNNRITPPDIRRGERLYLYRYGDTEDFYWQEVGTDQNLRSLETIILAFAAKPSKNNKKPPTPDNSYFFELSTHDKIVRFSTSMINGEAASFTAAFDLQKGTAVVEDEKGQYLLFDSVNSLLRHVNKENSIIEVNKKALNAYTDESMSFISKDIFFKASSSFTVDTNSLTTKSSSSTHKTGNYSLKSGGISMQGSAFTVKSPTSGIKSAAIELGGATQVKGPLLSGPTLVAGLGVAAPGGGPPAATMSPSGTLKVKDVKAMKGDFAVSVNSMLINGSAGAFSALQAPMTPPPGSPGPGYTPTVPDPAPVVVNVPSAKVAKSGKMAYSEFGVEETNEYGSNEASGAAVPKFGDGNRDRASRRVSVSQPGNNDDRRQRQNEISATFSADGTATVNNETFTSNESTAELGDSGKTFTVSNGFEVIGPTNNGTPYVGYNTPNSSGFRAPKSFNDSDLAESFKGGWQVPASAAIYAPYIRTIEQQYALPNNLIARICFEESAFETIVVNGTKRKHPDAVGIAGLRVTWHPLTTATDWQASVRFLGEFLSKNYKEFGNSWHMAIAAWNYTPSGVRQTKPYRWPIITKDYVKKIARDVNLGSFRFTVPSNDTMYEGVQLTVNDIAKKNGIIKSSNFSKRSIRLLTAGHDDLVVWANTVRSRIRCEAIEVGRTLTTQRRYVKEGRSLTLNSKHIPVLINGTPIYPANENNKNGINYRVSTAIDLLAYNGNKGTFDTDYYYPLAEIGREVSIELGIPIRWGGSWERLDQITDVRQAVNDYATRIAPRQPLIDMVHFELWSGRYPKV